MDSYEVVKKRRNLMKASVIFQLIFSLIGITLSLLDMLEPDTTHYLNAFEEYNIKLSSLQEFVNDKKVCVLTISIIFSMIAFFGYPGYKYDKIVLIVFHVLLSSILDIFSLFFFLIYIIKDHEYQLLKYLPVPFIVLVVSIMGLNYLHFLWNGSEELGEAPFSISL